MNRKRDQCEATLWAGTMCPLCPHLPGEDTEACVGQRLTQLRPCGSPPRAPPASLRTTAAAYLCELSAQRRELPLQTRPLGAQCRPSAPAGRASLPAPRPPPAPR
ncbi:uncharacterized protein [Macaca nemestrina]|uniref:uncharacterized protein n=1 Tax=Macaca nemestrina TaxID=9545 RepID=UPI0039B949BE